MRDRADAHAAALRLLARGAPIAAEYLVAVHQPATVALADAVLPLSSPLVRAALATELLLACLRAAATAAAAEPSPGSVRPAAVAVPPRVAAAAPR